MKIFPLLVALAAALLAALLAALRRLAAALLSGIFVVLFAGCLAGCAREYSDYPLPPPSALQSNCNIEEIKALYAGSVVTVNRDAVISGLVTANDRSGNFYRSFVIEDATGAVEIRAGMYDLHNLYPLGRRVAVKAKGLAVGQYNGVIQIGLKPAASSAWQVAYFAHRMDFERYISRGAEYSEVIPRVVNIDDLTGDMCGDLVRIEALTPADPGAAWAYPAEEGTPPQTGYRIFSDGTGNEICVTTSGYADFAGLKIPAGTVSVTGILMKGRTDTGRNMYMVKMRDAYDAESGN